MSIARPRTRAGYDLYRDKLLDGLIDDTDYHAPFNEQATDMVNVNTRNEYLSFGQAIKSMKCGQRVARKGWNGKNMFLYHVPANSYPPRTQAAYDAFGGEDVPYGAYIAMKTAQDNVVPWLASQTDMLTDDWVLIL